MINDNLTKNDNDRTVNTPVKIPRLTYCRRSCFRTLVPSGLLCSAYIWLAEAACVFWVCAVTRRPRSELIYSGKEEVSFLFICPFYSNQIFENLNMRWAGGIGKQHQYISYHVVESRLDRERVHCLGEEENILWIKNPNFLWLFP